MTSASVGRVAVTGATGFLGRHLCEYFQARGWRVRGLVRDVGRHPVREGIELALCDLPDRIDAAAFAGADVVIHCAYASREANLVQARRVNELGTERVYALGRAAGVRRFVFISTISAHDEALSYYARSKLAIEHTLDPERDLIIRPGLVLAPGGGGLFHRMVDGLRRTGMAPIFDGGRQVMQTVYIDDFCAAVHGALVSDRVGRYVVAEPEGLPVRDFFRLVAEKCGVRCRLVPLPTTPLLLALRAVERLGVALPISSENVLGMRSLRFQPSARDMEALGVHPRPTAESLDLVFPR